MTKAFKTQWRTQGGLKTSRLSLIFNKKFYLRKEDYCFPIHLLVNLSTYCKYHGRKLHANFKEHCKTGQKVIRFGGKLS